LQVQIPHTTWMFYCVILWREKSYNAKTLHFTESQCLSEDNLESVCHYRRGLIGQFCQDKWN
jgi:hypothetical protein